MLGLTLVSSLLLAWDLSRLFSGSSPRAALEHAAFLLIVAVMLYGNVVYQLTRLGHLVRQKRHKAASSDELWARLEDPLPAVVTLIPSYREDAEVVRRSLLAAALQDYASRRVVLLIDDPPRTEDPEARAMLEAARDLPRQLAELVEEPARRFAKAATSFCRRLDRGELDRGSEALRLAGLQAEGAAWLESLAARESQDDHAERHFIELVLRGPAQELLGRARQLECLVREGRLPSAEDLRRGYQRLAARFRVEVGSFERKRYVNLSHEPNKAMNLNAYLGLLGGRYREVVREDGLHLEPAEREHADLVVPAAEFVITLDADSLIAADYTLRLVDVMRREGNERVAVAQTPYCAFPGAPGPLERIAGATTDIQYIVHQGFTRHAATYWVGANALLRTAALEDLRSVVTERGYPVPKFIQDRTVIEDTESSVDLLERGWSLYNYPGRLAYSATPHDFGSLLIQRQRWANGGLLILPKRLRHLLQASWSRARLAEAACGVHYLVSIAAVNLGLLVLLLYPFEHSMQSIWLPLTALPYFLLYERDLRRLGYRRGDAIRAYALNLLLLPVNLGGVLSSLRQAVTGRRVPFGRTPKVASRTCVPAGFVAAEAGLLAALVVLLGVDVLQARWAHASFAVVNAGLLLYALVCFVGVRAGLMDLVRSVAAREVAREPHSAAPRAAA